MLLAVSASDMSVVLAGSVAVWLLQMWTSSWVGWREVKGRCRGATRDSVDLTVLYRFADLAVTIERNNFVDILLNRVPIPNCLFEDNDVRPVRPT